MLEVFRKLGSIQYDPLAVAGRSHDLVLHARVADYDPGWCDLLYERGEIFEAYNKGLSLVPAGEFQWFRATLSQSSPRLLAENGEVAERVLERGLLASLFDFDYVWELFLPPAKRRWGWYVLPITFQDRLVGRIEPRIDRAKARVRVIDVWWEDRFMPRQAEGFVDAMRDAFRAYLRIAGANRIEWAPHLGTEKRLFLARP